MASTTCRHLRFLSNCSASGRWVIRARVDGRGLNANLTIDQVAESLQMSGEQVRRDSQNGSANRGEFHCGTSSLRAPLTGQPGVPRQFAAWVLSFAIVYTRPLACCRAASAGRRRWRGFSGWAFAALAFGPRIIHGDFLCRYGLQPCRLFFDFEKYRVTLSSAGGGAAWGWGGVLKRLAKNAANASSEIRQRGLPPRSVRRYWRRQSSPRQSNHKPCQGDDEVLPATCGTL